MKTSIKSRRLHIAVIIGCTWSFACTNDLASPLDVQGTDSELIKPNGINLWPSVNVPVCWDGPTFSNPSVADFRTNVRRWTSEAISEVANISFTGWNACPSDVNGKIVIKVNPSEGTGSMGGYNSGAPTVMNFQTENSAKGYVLHEFMHALGFQHEFNRAENQVNHLCAWEGLQVGDTYGTSFDLDSITNSSYCGYWETLSSGDRAGLRQAYGTYKNKRIAVAANLDGRLELVYSATANVPYHRWEVSTNSSLWSSAALLGAPHNASKDLTVVRHQDGRLSAVYAGANDILYHITQTTANAGWNDEAMVKSSTNKAKRIVAARNTDGRIDLVYVNMSNELKTIRQSSANGSWGSEQTLGTSAATAKAIAIGQNSDGRLELFYTNTSDQLYHVWQTSAGGPWSGHALLGTASNKALRLAVIQNSDGKLQVFYIGTNAKLYSIKQAATPNGWGTETAVGSTTNTALEFAVGKNADGRLELFYTAGPTSLVLYHVWQNSAGGSWSPHGLLGYPWSAAKELTVGTNQDGHIELIYVGTDDVLYHAWYDAYGGSWSWDVELRP